MGSRLLKWEWGTNVPPTASTVAQAASVERGRIDNKRLSMGRSRGILVGPSRGPAFLANRPNAAVTFEKSAQAFPGCLGERLDPLEQVFAQSSSFCTFPNLGVKLTEESIVVIGGHRVASSRGTSGSHTNVPHFLRRSGEGVGLSAQAFFDAVDVVIAGVDGASHLAQVHVSADQQPGDHVSDEPQPRI